MQVTPLALANAAGPSIEAGCKLLLHGHVHVKYGMLQLHGGNAILLGGHVPVLVQKRKLVLEQLQKEGMVGVDPTIRALIGTHSAEEENDDDDDDDENDKDPADESFVMGGNGVGVGMGMGVPQDGQVVGAVPNHRTYYPPPPTIATRRTAPAPDAPAPAQAPLAPQRPPLMDRPGESPPVVAPLVPHHPPPAPPPPPLRTTTNPYHPSTSTVPATRNPLLAGAPSPAIRTTPHLPTAPVATYNPYTPLPATTMNSTAATVIHPHSTRAPFSTPAPAPLRTTNTPSPTRIAFAELYALLHRRLVVDDPFRPSSTIAAPTPSCCWLVDMKQWGTSIYFNVGKEKRMTGTEKKKNKVYHFEMRATFGIMSHNHNHNQNNSEQLPQQLIACQLPSTLIEPLFEASPSQLRTLARTDKAASQVITIRGGEKVRQVFFEPIRTWKATLLLSSSSPHSKDDNNDDNDANVNMDSGAERRLDDISDPILVLEPFE